MEQLHRAEDTRELVDVAEKEHQALSMFLKRFQRTPKVNPPVEGQRLRKNIHGYPLYCPTSFK